MPVEHIVWIKFKPHTTPERIERHIEDLRSLKGRLDVIKDLKIGRNFTDRANGFTHGMIVTLNCPNCLKEYLEHPDHIAVAAPLREDAELMAMDFEHK